MIGVQHITALTLLWLGYSSTVLQETWVSSPARRLPEVTKTSTTVTSSTVAPCEPGFYREEGDSYYAGEGGPGDCLMTLGTALARRRPPQLDVSLRSSDGAVVLTLEVEELPQVYNDYLWYSVDMATDMKNLHHNSDCSMAWGPAGATALTASIASRNGPCKFTVVESEEEATWSTYVSLFVVADSGYVAPPMTIPLTIRVALVHEASVDGSAAWGLESVILGEVDEGLPTPESALSIYSSGSYEAPMQFPLFVAGDSIHAMHALSGSALDYELSLLRVFLSTSADPDDEAAIQHDLTGEVAVVNSSEASQVRFSFIARPCEPLCSLHCVSRLMPSRRRLQAEEPAAAAAASAGGGALWARAAAAAADEAYGKALLTIQSAPERQVAFDGDYNEVVGENKVAFLTECSAELAPIRCIDVNPGSIVITLGVRPSDAGDDGAEDGAGGLLDFAVAALQAKGGLELPSFPALEMQTTSLPALEIETTTRGYPTTTEEVTTEQAALRGNSDGGGAGAAAAPAVVSALAVAALLVGCGGAGFAVWCMRGKSWQRKQQVQKDLVEDVAEEPAEKAAPLPAPTSYERASWGLPARDTSDDVTLHV